MKTLSLDYQGLAVHADREAWFNATEIAALFGRQPYEWLRLPETKRYIAALCKHENEKQEILNTGKSRITKAHFIKTKNGRHGGGTWLHPKLAVAFARWCDIDFAVWCDEQIERLLHDGKAWQADRTGSSIGFQIMAEILQATRRADGKDTQPHHYSNEALLCNAAVTGQFKSIERDTLNSRTLRALTLAEAKNAALIAQGLPYAERKARLFADNAAIRQQFQPSIRQSPKFAF